MLVIVTLRRVLVFTGIIAGFVLTFFALGQLEAIIRRFSVPETVAVLALGAALGGIIGALAAPFVQWLEGRLSRIPLVDIMAGTLGLILGLVVASLLANSLARIPWIGNIAGALGGLVFGYIGMSVAAKRRDEIAGLFSLAGRPLRGERKTTGDGVPKILDTSVIIDGRIADLCKSGFIEGTLIIPAFVLEELRHIADSGDMLKRNRGRRGLDVLNKMQKELNMPVQIVERDFGNGMEVDDKLIRLAKALNAKVVTNDYNLNKVAALQGVPVLNINELANAVKPVVLPGEEMTVQIIKDGKEAGQGVAYLDDGTMIVVDGGKRFIGDTIGVTVTSVLQTSAGRMIFAKPKPVERVVMP